MAIIMIIVSVYLVVRVVEEGTRVRCWHSV